MLRTIQVPLLFFIASQHAFCQFAYTPFPPQVINQNGMDKTSLNNTTPKMDMVQFLS
jgi:hypothetical protein